MGTNNESRENRQGGLDDKRKFKYNGDKPSWESKLPVFFHSFPNGNPFKKVK